MSLLESDGQGGFILDTAGNIPDDEPVPCAYCRDEKGRPVIHARRVLIKRYGWNGIPVELHIRLCELCNYARKLFPKFDRERQVDVILWMGREIRRRAA